MKSLNKKLVVIIIFFSFIFCVPCFAVDQDFEDISGLKNTGEEMGYTDMSTGSAPILIGNIISAILAFIGVIFMVLIWLGAFDIISSAGEEEKVKKGKDKIKNGTIGILIVFAAYLLAKLILTIVSGGATPIFSI